MPRATADQFPNRRQRPLKVLHVLRIIDRELTGGIHTYFESVAAALCPEDVQLHISAMLYGRRSDAPCQCPYAPAKGGGRIATSLRYAWWLHKNVREYDVVHIHGVYWTVLFVAPVCLWHRVPYVVSPHGSLLSWELRLVGIHWRIFRWRLGRRLLRAARWIIATTEFDAEADRAFEPAARISIVAPGISVPAQVQADPSSISGSLEMVFIGRLEPVKRLPFLIDVLAELTARGSDCRLHVIGTGAAEYQAELRERARRHDVDGRIEWHGYRTGEDLRRIASAANLFVLGSLWENFSFATAEAMALGLPVVVSDGVGLATLIERYDCGSVLPMREVADTATAIARYAKSDIAQRQGANGHRCAKEQLSLPTMGERLLAVYVNAVPPDAF